MSKLPTDLSSVTVVGLDLAKHVFQVHALDAVGNVVVARALWRKDELAFFAALPPAYGKPRNSLPKPPTSDNHIGIIESASNVHPSRATLPNPLKSLSP
ncbi:hypothetical protein [Sandaracinobacteroides saxicola]|uniref:Transposase n=1 Tax=Sandaracinobacteroides saxicola TaxID=2759707 RepID=A0A7G5IHW7_9SPHN|nr:hypothetical protein [Sandaracinobacteroides saxicola]QMW22959.1 hypothetical protein H3309_00125 [Sandaracinobacteroides saxicola]